MIVCENLCKTYVMGKETVKALDKLSITIEQGEFLSVTGKSGSGKSTLLHMLGGIDYLTSGSIKYDSLEITKFNEDEMTLFRRKNIGIVFQQYYLLPELNVRENILFPSHLMKLQIDEEYYNDILENLELRQRVNHLPSQISGGQMQRTAIARALINKPKVILCDEPTGNLDSITAQNVINSLLKIKNKYNQTIVIVTHDEELANMADRKIIIKDGKCIS